MSPGLISTQITNLKCWPSPLMVMDQIVLLRWKGQWKMFLHNLRLTLWLGQPLLPMLEHPENSRNGIINGFKVFYKKRSSSGPGTVLLIESVAVLNKVVDGLDKYTEYEFQVLAFTSVGDGKNSSVVVNRTKEDAPSKPPSGFNLTASSSTSITASWQLLPANSRNGIIKGFKLFYQEKGSAGPGLMQYITDESTRIEVVTGLYKYTEYEFEILAFTSVGDGPKSSILTERTKEDAPSGGPEPLSLSPVDKTTFNISWEPLPREKSHGKVILYEVKAVFLRRGNLRKRSVINSPSVNTSVTYVVLSDLELCAKYNVSVRAYTAEGPGPYGEPLELETSRPDAPGEFKVTDSGTNQITLAWKQYDKKETIVYAVKYTGTKSYNKTFRDEQTIEAIKATTQKVEGLIPGTTYKFRVHGTSVCGESASEVVSKMTDMMDRSAHPCLQGV